MEESRRNIPGIETALDLSFQKFETDVRAKMQFQPTDAWTAEQSTEQARDKRISECLKDFWKFDSVYFPPEVHRQGYAKPGILHKTIIKNMQEPGLHWFIAFRDLAKTAYGIKGLIWLILRGDVVLSGIYSEDLMKARLLMSTIEYLLKNNPKLAADFDINFITSNKDELTFKCRTNKYFCSIYPFSPDRSPRGNTVNLDRLDMILFDDVETLTSSLKPSLVKQRIDKLIEAYKSCKEDGVMIGFGNDFHPSCAANVLLKEKEKGVIREHVHIYAFPDWNETRTKEIPYQGSVWPERYPAKSEAEMRKMHRITDDVEWSQAQCRPILRSGHIFPKIFYQEYEKLPDDVRGPSWCDQNLSKKSLGDTTVMGALLYSPKNNAYYVYMPRCRSYSDPNLLLSDYLSIKTDKVTIMGMDGNVGQESAWEANIVNWCVLKRRPFPPIFFKRYTADNLITPAQIIYTGSQVYFPKGFKDTDEGEIFFEQFHSFEGKKAGQPDDAADWFICCVQLGFEEGYFQVSSGKFDYEVVSIPAPFSF